MDRFMTDDTVVLDSHKQAALLTICCLQLNIIEYSEIPQDDDELHIIPQMIAVNVGLSYMLQCLNDLLQIKKSTNELNGIIFLLPLHVALNMKKSCAEYYFKNSMKKIWTLMYWN